MRMIDVLVAGLPVLGVQAAPNHEAMLKPIDKAHCLRLYDEVELKLKGTGAETASNATRNGLKDFFVTRPGEVDCSGSRELPWTDEKDKDVIASVIKSANAALGANVDMARDYGVGPAPAATKPRR